MTNRRQLLIALTMSALAPLAKAQQKIWRIGFIYAGSRQSALETGRYAAFTQGMRELGYEEGKQYVLVARFADGDYSRLPAMAADLVAEKLDVIVSSATPTHDALKKVTSTVPIVATTTIDPVRDGYAETLARPGRNFTGLTGLFSDVFPKHIEFLKMAMPKLSCVGVLWDPGNSGHPALLDGVDAAARSKSIRTVKIRAGTPEEIEAGFRTMARERAEGFLMLGSTLFVNQFHQISALAVKHRLMSIYSTREYAEQGGFMSYGSSFRDNYRRAAVFVDKILKGARPGELPFEQPMKFELVINRKTAKALGLTISKELLLRADEVIG